MALGTAGEEVVGCEFVLGEGLGKEVEDGGRVERLT